MYKDREELMGLRYSSDITTAPNQDWMYYRLGGAATNYLSWEIQRILLNDEDFDEIARAAEN